MNYFNLAFSPNHMPSVHSSPSLSSINECNQLSSAHHHRLPLPKPSPRLTQNRRQLFPKAFSYCSCLLNTITGPAQFATPLTTAPCRHAVLYVRALSTVSTESRRTWEKIAELVDLIIRLKGKSSHEECNK